MSQHPHSSGRGPRAGSGQGHSQGHSHSQPHGPAHGHAHGHAHGPSDDHDHPHDHDHEELEDFDDELEPFEEILEEWEYLGWIDLLPSAAGILTTLFDGMSIAGIDVDAVIADARAAGELELIDDDPVWPVIPERHAEAAGIEGPEDYADYVLALTQDRTSWLEMTEQHPQLAVASVSELVTRMVDWGLLAAEGEVLSLELEVPDPLDVLPLDEDRIADLVLARAEPEMEAVQDALHDFLFHGVSDEVSVTVDRLAQQADVEPDIVRLTLVALISDPDSGLTADRFGPLDADALEALAGHQKFTLRVDRSVPAIAQHAH